MTMPGPATTATRRALRCAKHAFAPSASSRPRNGVVRDVTLPAQRHQTCLRREGLASESVVAGDDPVNGSDPSGDCFSVFGIVCLGPGASNGLNWDAAADSSWQTLKDFATGFVGNAEPACSDGWESLAYEDGNVAWWVGSLGGLLDGVTGGGNGGSEDAGAPEQAATGASDAIPWITPGSLPAAKESALDKTIGYIDSGTTPSGALAKNWGTSFKNWGGDLPGGVGDQSPYQEYRVASPPGTAGVGPLRVVYDPDSGATYYTWTHYGDAGEPAFVRIR